VITGLTLFVYKAYKLKFPLVPATTSTIWNVEATVSFEARYKPVKVDLYIPQSEKSLVVMDENFISRGFGLSTLDKGINRKAVWSIRNSRGRQLLFYRVVLHQLENKDPATSKAPSTPTKPYTTEPQLSAALSLIEEIQSHSADTDTFVTTLLQQIASSERNENLNLLLGSKPDKLRKMTTAYDVLAQAGIASRLVHGVRLEETKNAEVLHWLEVYESDRWKTHGPFSIEPGEPQEYLVWWRGQRPMVEIKGADRLAVNVAIARQVQSALDDAVLTSRAVNPYIVDYSLFDLPIATQAVYRVLLLIPLGALVVAIFRNIIGLKTFGTFMPVLIALAFRETQLLSGLVLFTIIIGIGLIVRSYIETLKLLLVPRLASVLVVVVLIMLGLSILTHRMGIEHGLSVALFPMVILTMTIERMMLTWEERGGLESLKQISGSLVVASISHLVMSNPNLEHLIFVFPELLLIVLALLILIGCYTGYRLLELFRFKGLIQKSV